MNVLIKLDNITKKYLLPHEEINVLNSISLDIEENKTYFINGVSGSGKSTLLRIMGAVDLEFEGTVFLDNKNIKRLDAWEISKLRREFIGFVFQDFHLLGHLTGVENIILPGLFADKKYEDVKKRAYYLIEKLGITNVAQHNVNLLSRGEKQRVAFARALINSPSIVLSDEPTASLDEKNREKLFSLINELKKEKSFTFIAVSHHKIIKADTVFSLSEGKVERTNES